MNARTMGTRRTALALAAIAAGLAACGGGGEDEPAVLTGRFVDSAVAGIGYRTETRQGVTGAGGEFGYVAGEHVTFFLGQLAFPSAPAGPLVTPLTLAGTSDVNDRRVVNMARLLLSLDANANPGDGIQVPAGAATVAAAVDFDVEPAAFAASTAVTNLVLNSGSLTTSLVDAGTAVAHLGRSVGIVGTWFTQGAELSVLSLFASGEFVYAETSGELPNGVEAGTYAYDAAGRKLTFTRTFASGTTGGIGPGQVLFDALLEGEALTIREPGTSNGLALVRQPFGTGIAGTWADLGGAELPPAVLTLLADGRWVFSETSGELPNGVEAGTYVYDDLAEELTFTRSFASGTDGGVGGGTQTGGALLDGDALTLLEPGTGATAIVLARQ